MIVIMKWIYMLIMSTLPTSRALPMSAHVWFCILLIGTYSIFITLAPSTHSFDDYFAHVTSSQLNQSLQSSQFKLSLLLSLAAVCPMIIDVMFDIRNKTDRDDEKMHWYCRLIVLAGLAIPNILLGSFNFGTASATVYIIGFCFYRLTINGCGIAYMARVAALKKLGNSAALASIMFVLNMITHTCRALSILCNPSHSQIFYTMSVMARGCSFFLAVYGARDIYYSKAALAQSPNYAMGSYELIMLIYFFSLTLLNFTIYSISVYYDASDELNASGDCICMYSYVHMVFTVTIVILQSRVARMETQNQSKSMSERQAFIRYISHEIRTPLNTVFLGLEFVTSLLKKFHPQEGDESIFIIIDTLGDIYSSCEISLSILNDLLTFDKMEGKKMTLELEFINCCSFITSIAKPFSVNAKEKNIILNVNYDQLSNEFIDYGCVNIDHSKMGQVMRNLISNALKFTSADGVVNVHIKYITDVIIENDNKSISKNSIFSSSCDSNDIPNHYVRVEVQDTGAGISIDNQQKLFGQYVQFDANKLQKGNGSGLGLWISKGITELHGGTVRNASCLPCRCPYLFLFLFISFSILHCLSR